MSSTYVIHSKLTGREFEKAFARAVRMRAKVVDEVKNIVSYTVENGVAQVYWFDGLHTVFVEDEDSV